MRKIIIPFLLFSASLILGCQEALLQFTPAVCEQFDLNVSSEHNMLVHPTNNNISLTWRGKFSEDFVLIYFTRQVGFHGERVTSTFRFRKFDSCLELDYAYHAFTAFYYLPTRLSNIEVESFQFQDWEEDSLFSGELTFNYGPDSLIGTVTRKFWVEFGPDDEYIAPTISDSFEESLGTQLPIRIDLNNDATDDFVFDYSIEEFDSSIHRKRFNLRCDPLNAQNNVLAKEDLFYSDHILVGTNSSSFEAVLSNDSNRNFAYRQEFEAPFQNYNQWVLTYRNQPADWVSGYSPYIMLRMNIGGQFYFGWIQIKMNFVDSTLEVLNTYFHPVPNEHITIP